jgi:hypothetical protein
MCSPTRLGQMLDNRNNAYRGKSYLRKFLRATKDISAHRKTSALAKKKLYKKDKKTKIKIGHIR